MNSRQLKMLLGLAISFAALIGDKASAALVPITNADFEADVAADGAFNPAKTGWGATANGFGTRSSGSIDPDATGGAIFGGENNFLQVQADNNPGGPLGGVSFVDGGQAVSPTIAPLTRYTLTVDVASRSPIPFSSNVPANDVYVGFGGGPELLARLVNVAAGTGLGETSGVTLVSTSPIPANGQVKTWTRVYETNAAPGNLGGALFIQLFIQSNTAGGLQEALFDNVSLDVTTIPEPRTLVLFGLSSLAVTFTRRIGRAERR